MRSIVRLIPNFVTVVLCSLLSTQSASLVAAEISRFDEDKLRQIPVALLCNDLYLFRADPDRYGHLSEQAWKQLERVIAESGVSKAQLQWARQGRVVVGMGACALKAAKGAPVFTRSTQTSGRLRERFEYEDGSSVLFYQGVVIER